MPRTLFRAARRIEGACGLQRQQMIGCHVILRRGEGWQPCLCGDEGLGGGLGGGFGVWGLGFGVWGLGFGVRGLGFGVWVCSCGGGWGFGVEG